MYARLHALVVFHLAAFASVYAQGDTLIQGSLPPAPQLIQPPVQPAPPVTPQAAQPAPPAPQPVQPAAQPVTPAPQPTDQPNAPTLQPTAQPGQPTALPNAPTIQPTAQPNQPTQPAQPNQAAPQAGALPANQPPTQPGGNSAPVNAGVAPLLAFKAGLDNGNSVSALSTWKQGGNPCDRWEGVTCGQGGNIIKLDLTSAELKGDLEPTLAQLTSLTSLKLGSNSLTGPIPASWADGNNAFPSLIEMDLSSNQLTGDLPAGFSSMGALQTLRLGSNGFTGELPSGWGEGFGSLQLLSLGDNKLSGALPPAWGTGFSSLKNLDISGNELDSTIPAIWGAGGSFPNLGDASLVLKPGNDQLCGKVPAGLAPKVGPPSAISGGSLLCNGATAAAPNPAAATAPASQPNSAQGPSQEPAQAPTNGGGAVAGGGNSGSNVVGARFGLQGGQLTPFTEQRITTTASAIKTALGSEFSGTQLKYLGGIAKSTSRRKLLQSGSGFDAYYNIQKVADTGALQSRLQASDFNGRLQGLLNQQGVPVNSVSVDQVSPGGITIPGQPTKKSGGGSSISTGAIIGIAVAAVAVLALLLLLLCCCCLKKKRKSKKPTYERNELESEKSALSPVPVPTQNYTHKQSFSPPMDDNIKHPRVGEPIVLNTDETSYQGRRVDLSQNAGSPQRNPMYSVAPTDGTNAFLQGSPPPEQESKLASWWGGRKAGSTAKAGASETAPVASPFSPQHDTGMEYSAPGGETGAGDMGGGGTAGGRGVAEWLRPDSGSQMEPQHGGGVSRTGERKPLSNIVTDIRNI